MIQKEKYIGLGMDQDTAPDKRKNDTYWDAKNIRIINNGRNLSIKPIKKSIIQVAIPAPTSGTLYMVGTIEFKNNLYIFLSNNNATPSESSEDFIYRLNVTGTLTVITSGSFYFSSSNPIEALGNYENENIIKLYWVDGYNQLRALNVADTPLPLSVTGSDMDIVSNITYCKPEVTIQTGGALIAGKIQYGYSLFKLNGSETKISPLSNLISIAINEKGGKSGEIMNISTKVTLSSIDTDFNYIRLFSVHYQELNQTPKITLIVEQALDSNTFTYIDDGNSFIAEYSLDQFLLQGGDPIFPNTIASKRNHLFSANYKSIAFDIPFSNALDCRVYSFPKNNIGFYIKNVGGSPVYTTNYTVSENHDAVNPNFLDYRYKYNSSTPGATGLNFTIGINEYSTGNYNGTDPMSLKQGEIYRIGVIFFNKYGQKSSVKWMTDLQIPRYATTKSIIGLDVNINSGRTSYFTDAGAVNYRVVSVERKSWDRTVITQGFIVPGIRYIRYDNASYTSPYYHPGYLTKDIRLHILGGATNIDTAYTEGVDWFPDIPLINQDAWSKPARRNDLVFLYSSDSILENNVDLGTSVKILGVSRAEDSECHYRVVKWYNYKPEILYIDNANYKTDGFSTTVESDFPACITTPSLYTSFDKMLEYEYVSVKNYDYCILQSSYSDIVITKSKFYKSGALEVLDGYAISNYTSMPNISATTINLTTFSQGELESGFTSEYPGAVAIKFATSTWHKNVNDFDKFIIDDYPSRCLPIIELLRELPNQYGGFSYEAKQRNKYNIKGELANINTTVYTNYIGDIYVGNLRVNRSNGGASKQKHQWDLYEIIDAGILENNHDIFSRADELFNWAQSLSSTIEYKNYTINNNHSLLKAYNQKSNLVTYYATDALFEPVKNYSNRIIASNVKYSGELVDSWTKILVNETIDVDGIYGELTKLYTFKGELLAFQEHAVSQIAVQPRVQTTGNDGIGIYLGTGQLLHDYTYINTHIGTQDKLSIIDNNKILMFYDVSEDSLNTLDGEKISNILGISSILKANTNTLIKSTYDLYNDEFLFTFDTYTLVYSTITNKFVTKYDDKLYINNVENTLVSFDMINMNILKLQADTDYRKSEITYMFTPNPNNEKIFHNLEYRLYGQDFNEVKVDDFRNTSGVTTTDIKNKFDIHRMYLPRIFGTRERFRGISILTTLYNDGGPNDYSLDDMVLMYNLKN